MVVMILEVVPPSVRGELTRWLMPVTANVFVGRVSAEIRDLLWLQVTERCDSGRVVQLWRAANEQGFAFRLHNVRDRVTVDLDGLNVLAARDAAWLEAVDRFRLHRTEVDSPDT